VCCFETVPACGGQIDGQTARHYRRIYVNIALCIASCADVL